MMKTALVTLAFTTSMMAIAQTDPTVATVNSQQIKFSNFDQTYKQNTLVVSDKKVTKEKVLTDIFFISKI